MCVHVIEYFILDCMRDPVGRGGKGGGGWRLTDCGCHTFCSADHNTGCNNADWLADDKIKTTKLKGRHQKERRREKKAMASSSAADAASLKQQKPLDAQQGLCVLVVCVLRIPVDLLGSHT